jgi:hypothetical protein
MGDMDRPIHFRRNHQTTDEWYASTLDAQVRARWKAPPKDIAKKAALGNRLAGLYGANTSSKMVRRRAGRLVHELEKASFNSPASLRRSMSPKKNKKRGKTSYKSPSGSSSVYLVDANDLSSPGERGAFTPGSDATNRPTTNTSSTYIEANIQTLPNTPSGNQLGGVMMESVDNYSTHTKRNSNSPTKRRGYNHVQSKVSPKPKYQRSKFKGPQFKGFYVGAGKAAPGSPFGSVPRYGFQGTINVLKKEHPMMMSPIGLKTRNTPKKKGMLTIPRSNVYTQPFTFKPTRDWPAEAFKMSNRKKKKGEITARDTRGVQFELNEVTKLYDFASEEKIYRKQESRMKLKSTGLNKFNPDGTPRRNALKHLGSVGKLKYVYATLYIYNIFLINADVCKNKKNDVLKKQIQFFFPPFLHSMCVSYISTYLYLYCVFLNMGKWYVIVFQSLRLGVMIQKPFQKHYLIICVKKNGKEKFIMMI